MAKRPNYDFEKRKKEQDRKTKKDAKREERLARRRAGQDPDLMPEDGGESPGDGTTDTAGGDANDVTTG